MRRATMLAAAALLACGGPTAPESRGEDLVEHEVRISGRISSASRLLALPVKLSIPGPSDPIGLDNVIDSTTSGAGDGRYELRAVVEPAACEGRFVIVLYDAFGRFVGKTVRGCGQHSESFNVGPGFPTS